MTPFVGLVTEILSFLTVVGDITAGVMLLALLFRKSDWAKSILGCFFDWAWLLALLVSLGAVLGSLFYSEVAGFSPCVLCWWQRVLLYPQLVLFIFGLFKKDNKIWNYSLTLSILGFVIAVYNTYLQFGGLSLGPCAATGPSCSERYFLEFGYITLPTMSLTAFAFLIILALTFKLKSRDGNKILSRGN